jgi:nucleoside-diphosphate-sugar epimerase
MVPTVLLTGVTGFVGGATAVELLLRYPDCRLLLMIRAGPTESAEERLRRSLARFTDLSFTPVVDPSGSHLLRRWEILRGDLTDPRAMADPRLDQVTHVLHLAANTSFRSVRAVRQTNILGTLALAHRMRRVHGLERFLYVGTAYICGANAPPVVQEDDYPHFNVQHLVEYTASKAECEMLLEQTAPELPLVIARPSVVVGHTRLGCLPSASIFWYYRTLDLLRRVPVPLTRRKDIVPVDYTAEALVFLLLKPTLRHFRYHVSAGGLASVSWQEMSAAFSCTHGNRPEEPYRMVDYLVLMQERHRLRECLGPGDEDRLLRVLEMYFRFSKNGVEVFDNHRLLEEGMPAPPRFTDYLPTCAMLPPDRSVYDQMLDDA